MDPVDDATTQDRAPDHADAARLSQLLAELAAPSPRSGDDSTDLPLPAGERLDRFTIRAVLGRGGFGTVYEAWDAGLGRAVALKLLRPRTARAAVPADEIRREAEAVAKLNHPGIVTLHDVGSSERGHYLVMERLEGRTLAERLREGPLPWRDAVGIACEIAGALAHAHRRGVLHRDLKPANVFLCADGRVKILDFGLAHLIGSGAVNSGGTPSYMAPEQLRGETVDARADVFALGVVLAQMITGEVPPRESAEEAAGATLPGVAIPARLARTVSRFLAPEPDGRAADGAAAAAELDAFCRSREARRRWAWTAAIAVVCAGVLAIGLATRPARLPAGRLVVAMADLENRTGDAALDGVGVLLGNALEQSRRVALMNRDTLVRLLAKGSDGAKAIGEAEALTAARAAGAQLVIVPSVRPSPGGFELGVQVVDVARAGSIFSARERGTAPESLYGGIDRLAARIRVALAEDASEAPRTAVPVTAYAPADAKALELWYQGERLAAEADLRGARPKWEAALARDPSFPLPRLSILQASLGMFTGLRLPLDERVRREHTQALRRDLARLPEALRPWAETLIVKVDAGYANHTEYLAALDAAIAARPEQPAPYFMAVRELLQWRGDAEAARPYLDHLVKIAPYAGLAELSDYLVAAGRFDDALAVVQPWAEQSRSALSLMNLCVVQAVRGEPEAALAAARALLEVAPHAVCVSGYLESQRFDELDAAMRAAPIPPDYFYEKAEIPMLRGRIREALRILDTAPKAPGSAEATAGWPTVRAIALLARGEPRPVVETLTKSFSQRAPGSLQIWVLAEAGDVRLATAMAGPAPDRLVGHRISRALRTWKDGDPEAALAEFAAISAAASEFYQGQILAQLGRHEEAVERFRRYRRAQHVDVRLREALLPRSLVLEAESLVAIGEREQARRVIDVFGRLWAGADAELPLVARARALERRLAD